MSDHKFTLTPEEGKKKMETMKAEADAVAEIVRAASVPIVVNVLDPITQLLVPVLMLPEKMKVSEVPFDKYRDRPVRRAGTATAGTIASFIDLVVRSENPHSVVFASRSDDGREFRLTAVIDYNQSGPEGGAHFGKHRVSYDFPISEPWELWMQNEGEPMAQSDFAAFIEGRIADLGDPDTASDAAKDYAKLIGCPLATPARILELSRGLSIRVDSTVGATVNLGTGEKQLTYTEAHNDEGMKPIKVPGAFMLQIPVFVDDGTYSIPVRLTYKIEHGRVVWKYAMYRADRAIDHAFKGAVENVKMNVKSSLYFGSPEA